MSADIMSENDEAARLASETLVAMEQLADVLARENGALESNDGEALKALSDEKISAGRGYEMQVKAMADLGADLGKLETNLHRQIEDSGSRLAALTDENERRLKVALEANRRLMSAVSEAVKAMAPGPAIYSRAGTVGPNSAAAPSGNVSISVDRRL